jgi:hypothetical protein
MHHIEIYRLRTQHREVRRALTDEQRRTRPDQRRIAELWRRKLVLSEALVRLED